MKAKDLMIPLQEYLSPKMTLREAAKLLRTAKRDEEKIGVKALPVLDPSGKLIGILSIGDILRAVFPDYLSVMNLGHFTWDGMAENLAKKAGDKKVSEMMTTPVVTVDDNSPLMECVDHMLKNNVRRLPVLAKDGKVVGMLYERDVFFAITKVMVNDAPGGGK